MATSDIGTDHCRVTPPGGDTNIVRQIQFYRHLFAYYRAASWMSPEAAILEIGSGEGYGANYLAAHFPRVTATDLSRKALLHIKSRYPDIASVCQILGTHPPFSEETFDVVIALQVVEHVAKASHFVKEARRILKERGVFILTTPNRNIRLLPFQRPWNPYHVHEYTGPELLRLLSRHFGTVNVYGVMAQPSLMLIEQARVKQSPIAVYGGMTKKMLARLCPRLLSLVKPMNAKHGLYPRPTTFTPSYHPITANVESFFLSSEVSHSLDLFAVAIK